MSTVRSIPVVMPPEVLFRVERLSPALRFSRIDEATAALDGAGNRFDVLGSGVLYAASTAQAALAETAAHFRVSATLLELLEAAGASASDSRRPSLGAAWRDARVIRSLCLADPLPFVDIEDARTHVVLTERARPLLKDLGVPHLDVPTVRGRSRLLTRGLATWARSATDDTGDPLYGGIRYLSKLSNDYECWAIFEGARLDVCDERRITRTDADLLAVADRHGILLD